MTTVLVAAAMRGETVPIVRRLSEPRRSEVDGVPVVRGYFGRRPILVVRTGEGGGAAGRAVQSVLVRQSVGGSQDTVGLVIATGVAGALSAEFALGDLAIAERLVDPSGAALEPAPDRLATGSLVEHVAGTVRSASFLSSDQILATAAAKAAALAGIDAASDALACVDLETAAVACAASNSGVPYVAIRAISDLAGEDMPIDFARFQREDGSVRRGGVAWHALCRPWKMPALLRLHRQTARGMATVANSLAVWIPRLACI